jgi:hypothetical protein
VYIMPHIISVGSQQTSRRLGPRTLAGACLSLAVMNVSLPLITGALPSVRALCQDSYGAGHYADVGIWLQVSVQ